MLEFEVLVLELGTVNALTAGTVVVGEVAPLAHEPRNDPVEAGSGVSESLLPGAEGAKVLSGLGGDVGTELHDDSSGGLSTNGHVEVYLRVGPVGGHCHGVGNDVELSTVTENNRELTGWLLEDESIGRQMRLYASTFHPSYKS